MGHHLLRGRQAQAMMFGVTGLTNDTEKLLLARCVTKAFPCYRGILGFALDAYAAHTFVGKVGRWESHIATSPLFFM